MTVTFEPACHPGAQAQLTEKDHDPPHFQCSRGHKIIPSDPSWPYCFRRFQEAVVGGLEGGMVQPMDQSEEER